MGPGDERRVVVRRDTTRVKRVIADEEQRCFHVFFAHRVLPFPYARCDPRPTRRNPIVRLFVDKGVDRRGFTYVLRSGVDGCVLLDYVLDHNCDPGYLGDMLLYKLSLAAQDRWSSTAVSLARVNERGGLRPGRVQEILEQTNYRKTLDELVTLLHALGYDVDFTLRPNRALRQQPGVVPQVSRVPPSASPARRRPGSRK